MQIRLDLAWRELLDGAEPIIGNGRNSGE